MQHGGLYDGATIALVCGHGDRPSRWQLEDRGLWSRARCAAFSSGGAPGFRCSVAIRTRECIVGAAPAAVAAGRARMGAEERSDVDCHLAGVERCALKTSLGRSLRRRQEPRLFWRLSGRTARGATLDLADLLHDKAFRALRDQREFVRRAARVNGGTASNGPLAWNWAPIRSGSERFSATGHDDARTFLEWRFAPRLVVEQSRRRARPVAAHGGVLLERRKARPPARSCWRAKAGKSATRRRSELNFIIGDYIPDVLDRR